MNHGWTRINTNVPARRSQNSGAEIQHAALGRSNHFAPLLAKIAGLYRQYWRFIMATEQLLLNSPTSPVEEFSDALFQVLSENKELLSNLAIRRLRCENWLRLETYKRLYLGKSFECGIECAYLDSKERCDFHLRNATSEAWIEVKLCVTNYAKGWLPPPSARPITNQISSIEQDIQKLRHVTAIGASKYLFLVGYPLPENHAELTEWQGHLRGLSAAMEKVSQLTLQKEDKTTCLVIYRASIAS